MKKQSGFSALEIILIVAIVGLIAAVGWLFYSNVTKNNAASEQTSSVKTGNKESEDKTVAKKTFTSTALKVSFDYPTDWTVKPNPKNDNRGTGENTTGDNMVIVSPSGFTMFFDELAPGGLGGVCPPYESTDFKLFGETKLDLKTYVVGFSDENAYNLYVSTKPDQNAVNNDSCNYNGVLELKKATDDVTPAILLFGNRVVGQTQISTQKPSSTELQQAADILRSARNS